MKQGATGFLKIKIDDVIRIDEVNSIVFTVTTPDRDLQFKKSYPDDVAYEDGYYYIPLFQQDTVNMEGVYKIEAQINMKSAEVVKTTINKLFINSSLNTTMLDSNPSFKQIGSLVDMKVEGIAIGRDGENGATFTPIMTGTVLSWKNDKGYENPQPVDLKGAPYEESQEFKDYYKKVLSVVKQAENVSGEIDTKQEAFNNNYESKVQETDKYFDDKKTQASITLNQYVETEKVNMQKFVAAEQEKYNQNAEDKINKFNNNAENKTNGFNQNAKSKQDSFDENSVNKTNDFNSNASTKTSTFNENYIQKSSDFNSSVETAKNEIAEQKQSSILEIENKTEYGKNVINSNKNSALADINDKRVEAIEEVEAQAKSYQVQIDELKESDKSQNEDIENLKATVDTKITQPYINNNDSTQITSSDNGLMSDLVIKGNTVQNSTKGLNLLKLNNDTITSNGVTSTCLNNVIKFSGTLTSSWANISTDTRKFLLNKDVQYIFSIDKALNMPCNLQLYYKDTTTQDVSIYKGRLFSDSFMIKDDLVHIRVFVTGRSGTVVNSEIKIMVNEGTTAKPYEPYTGGKPSPSPEYPQEVKGVDKIEGKIIGKNLFDINKINSKSNTTSTATINSVIDGVINAQWDTSYQSADIGSSNSSSGWVNTFNNSIELQPNTYTLSFKHKVIKKLTTIDNLRDFFIRVSNKTDNSIITDVNFTGDFANFKNISNTFALSEVTSVYLLFSCNNCQIEIKDIQLEISSTATDYQPYQSQSFNYTLSNPLYRLSDSVYDYIDIDRGKIIRNIGVITFDGSDDEEISKVGDTNINVYQFSNAINSIEKYAKYAKCDSFQIATTYVNDLLRNDNKIYTATISCYLSFDKMDTVEKLRAYLQQNPITVYYQLATPTEEDIPQELLTQLQSLKTYYPQTNIIWNTEIEPYINFDYKLNLPAWLEDKDNKDIIYDKKIEEIVKKKDEDKYSSTFFENMFALQRTGDVYTVKFPKWETSHVSTGEKLDANAGLICEPSTKTIKGKNNYANIPLFKTYDVNAYVDDEGVRHVTAIKGDGNFKDEGKVDVFVLGMSYYEKYWEDEQYWYYSRTDMPKEGYTVARECINRDGTIQPFALYAKYVSGDIDGVLYSSKGLMPSRRYDSTTQLGTLNANNSYSGMIFAFQKRGKFYSGGMTCDYKYILTTFYLKYATLNSQRIMTGCTNYSFQYVASIQSEDKSTYFPLTKSQANTVEVGSYVSVGYTHINKSTDRYYQNMHMYANNVKVLRKEAIDDNNVAIYLDVKEPFNTMPITVADGVVSDIYISSMHWYSGFSDDVLDRDGCPCDTNEQLTNGKFPMVIQGIECMVGGYETYGNAFMDIVDATGKREVYIQNDASLLTTDMIDAKSTYKKSPYSIQPQKLNAWNYITRIDFDLENGAFVQTECGQESSGTGVGFADGIYIDNASSGQREFLGFSYLWAGSIAGLSCCSAYNNVVSAYWSFLARLSINGVRG